MVEIDSMRCVRNKDQSKVKESIEEIGSLVFLTFFLVFFFLVVCAPHIEA